MVELATAPCYGTAFRPRGLSRKRPSGRTARTRSLGCPPWFSFLLVTSAPPTNDALKGSLKRAKSTISRTLLRSIAMEVTTTSRDSRLGNGTPDCSPTDPAVRPFWWARDGNDGAFVRALRLLVLCRERRSSRTKRRYICAKWLSWEGGVGRHSIFGVLREWDPDQLISYCANSTSGCEQRVKLKYQYLYIL